MAEFVADTRGGNELASASVYFLNGSHVLVAGAVDIDLEGQLLVCRDRDGQLLCAYPRSEVAHASLRQHGSPLNVWI